MKKLIYSLMLQLFAYDPSAQPENNTGSSELSVENKTFYNRTLLENAKPNLIHEQGLESIPIPKKSGKRMELRRPKVLAKATTPLTEGVTPDGTQISVSAMYIDVFQYGAFAAFTDMLNLTTIDDMLTVTTQLQGDQAGLTRDSIIRDILNESTNVSYCDKVSSGTETPITNIINLDKDCMLTVKMVKKIANKLAKAGAKKINGYYLAKVHPDTVFELTEDPDWKKPHEYVDTKNIYDGEIGKIAGVRFIESTEAKIYCGKDLASDTRNLAVNGAMSAKSVIDFDGSTAGVAVNELKGRWVLIGTGKYYVGANTATQMTLYTDEGMQTAASVTCSDNTVIYPGEGGKEGLAVYSSIFHGANAAARTEIEGAGLESIMKQLGSSGSADPLNQRATVGWKTTLGAGILNDDWLVKVLSCSKEYSSSAEGN